MAILVTTPTGNIGNRVVDRLLAAGAEVSVLVRDPARLSPAVRERATVHVGDLQNAESLKRAAAGAEALFLLVPPNFGTTDLASYQLGVGRAAVEAVRANGIRHVVFLSSIGAERDDMLAVSRLGQVEKLLEAAVPNIVSLRAGYFMENLLSAADTIRDQGAFYSTVGSDTPLSFVATRDIGDVAAHYLLDRSWTGHIAQTLYGAEPHSHREVVEILGRLLDRPVQYVQIDGATLQQVLAGFGATPHVAEEYANLFRRIDEFSREGSLGAPSIVTPTPLAEWLQTVMVPAVLGPQPVRVPEEEQAEASVTVGA